jgi:hypothetical protein
MRSPLDKPHRITSPFGTRTLNGKLENHNGIDLVPLDGRHPTDIFAVCDGVVTHVISNLPDSHTGLSVTSNTAGNLIRYQTEDGFSIINYHLKGNSVMVTVGQKIKEGQKIATMGTTGRSTGIHLHYEIRDPDNKAIDPALYLGTGKPLVEKEDEEMTKEQFKKMFLEEMDDYKQQSNTLPASNWAVNEMKQAVEIGITDGTRPRANATREEVAVMITRATATK